MINSGWNFDSVNENGLIPETNQSNLKFSSYNNLALNGTTFSNVQAIEKDTVNLPKGAIYKIWIAKNKGLIGYQYFGKSEFWSLIN